MKRWAKVSLGVSLALNLVLFLLFYLSQSSIDFETREAKRVGQIRIKDIKMLETLLVDRIAKDEVLKEFASKYSNEDYFNKPSEMGVGASSLFLVFGKNGKLQRIQVNDFADK